MSAVQLPICQNQLRVTARVTQLAEFMKCLELEGFSG